MKDNHSPRPPKKDGFPLVSEDHVYLKHFSCGSLFWIFDVDEDRKSVV